jgi:arylsulfatase A-like enzyme
MQYAGFLATLVAGTVSFSGAAQAAPNILLIFGDDMGVETLASYGVGENPPTTATLDEMAREGMRFTNFWAQPVCSPTRATVITGRYGFRTGIGRPAGGGGSLPAIPEEPEWASPAPVAAAGGMGAGMGAGMGGGRGAGRGAAAGGDPLQGLPRHGLSAEEYTLPMAFRANAELGYSTAAIGKWHLADGDNGWIDHPNNVGFDHYSGLITGTTSTYFSWNEVANGEVTGETGYTPADKTDDAIAWIEEQGEQPWFMWFAFNLPHTPIHLPPEDNWQADHSDLDSRTISAADGDAYFDAMMEAMDTQIGRLLASMDAAVRDNTYVIFLGDNGTSGGQVRAPFQNGRAKGTIYQGGVNTPLIITGPGIGPGAEPDALVNSSDLFVTIMEMAGIDPEETVPGDVVHDSVSFFPVLSDPSGPSPRDWVYVDEFFGGFAGVETADYAMRNERYKLLRFEGEEEFYDLQDDPFEHENLLVGELSADQQAEYLTLQEQIATLRSSE